MNKLRSPHSQPKKIYGGQLLLPKSKALNQTISPSEPTGQVSAPTGQVSAPTGRVEESFNRMMNIGQVGGLGGRMGQLEQASMRLAEAASQRKTGEMEKEYGLRGGQMEREYELRGGLLEKEIAAKTAGIGLETKASEKASLDSQVRALQSKDFLTEEERDRLNQINRQLGLLQ
jgi:hypothetical protein